MADVSTAADRPESPARRGFFRAASGVAGAALVAPALLAGGAAGAAESAAERTKRRYQETDHVKTFYETNRY